MVTVDDLLYVVKRVRRIHATPEAAPPLPSFDSDPREWLVALLKECNRGRLDDTADTDAVRRIQNVHLIQEVRAFVPPAPRQGTGELGRGRCKGYRHGD